MNPKDGHNTSGSMNSYSQNLKKKSQRNVGNNNNATLQNPVGDFQPIDYSEKYQYLSRNYVEPSYGIDLLPKNSYSIRDVNKYQRKGKDGATNENFNPNERKPNTLKNPFVQEPIGTIGIGSNFASNKSTTTLGYSSQASHTISSISQIRKPEPRETKETYLRAEKVFQHAVSTKFHPEELEDERTQNINNGVYKKALKGRTLKKKDGSKAKQKIDKKMKTICSGQNTVPINRNPAGMQEEEDDEEEMDERKPYLMHNTDALSTNQNSNPHHHHQSNMMEEPFDTRRSNQYDDHHHPKLVTGASNIGGHLPIHQTFLTANNTPKTVSYNNSAIRGDLATTNIQKANIPSSNEIDKNSSKNMNNNSFNSQKTVSLQAAHMATKKNIEQAFKGNEGSTDSFLDCDESLLQHTNNSNTFSDLSNNENYPNFSYEDKCDWLQGNNERLASGVGSGFRIPESLDLHAIEPLDKADYRETAFHQEGNTLSSQSSQNHQVSAPPINIEEELENFTEDNNVWIIDSETLNYLVSREAEYIPDPFYFEKKQTNVTWLMRAILLDWMMEASMEFTLKRETFHLSVSYVDRYLSIVPNVQKVELQLIGISALLVASKIEEIYAPKIADFEKSADFGYNCQQIREMEEKLIRAFGFLLYPPTLSMWANWYMSQWDIYLDYLIELKNARFSFMSQDPVKFKQPNEKSYICFREMMQLIDVLILDVQILQYKNRVIIASVMYLLIGKHYKQFLSKEIVENFSTSSTFLVDPTNRLGVFNSVFEEFLNYSFGFQIYELLPTIQFVASFFRLQFNYDLPTAAKINKDNILEGHFEDFLAFQTHHQGNLALIKKRPRTIF